MCTPGCARHRLLTPSVVGYHCACSVELTRGLVCLVFSGLSCSVSGLCPLGHSGLSVAAQGRLGKVGGRVVPSPLFM